MPVIINYIQGNYYSVNIRHTIHNIGGKLLYAPLLWKTTDKHIQRVHYPMIPLRMHTLVCCKCQWGYVDLSTDRTRNNTTPGPWSSRTSRDTVTQRAYKNTTHIYMYLQFSINRLQIWRTYGRILAGYSRPLTAVDKISDTQDLSIAICIKSSVKFLTWLLLSPRTWNRVNRFSEASYCLRFHMQRCVEPVGLGWVSNRKHLNILDNHSVFRCLQNVLTSVTRESLRKRGIVYIYMRRWLSLEVLAIGHNDKLMMTEAEGDMKKK